MSESEKQGFFKKASKFVKDAYEEDRRQKAAAAETEKAFYEEAAEKYGRLVASEIFDHRRIELFDKGFVRVGAARNRKGGPTPAEPPALPRSAKAVLIDNPPDYVVAYDAPFEKLRAIKAATQVQDKSAGGRGVAAVASFGLSEMTSNEKRFLFLTISTDRETYSLKGKAGMLRSADQVPMRLELAGQGILDSLDGAQSTSAIPTGATEPAVTTVTEQLKDLAALHRDSVLTDEEFTSDRSERGSLV